MTLVKQVWLVALGYAAGTVFIQGTIVQGNYASFSPTTYTDHLNDDGIPQAAAT